MSAPNAASEHVIDWFHITMRITVLQQQTKALQAERADEGSAASKQIDSIKHLLWHGNVDEALDRIDNLFIDLDLIRGSRLRRKSWRRGSRTCGPTSGTTGNRSPTTGSGTGGRNDQHGVCGIDHPPSGEPPVCEETADAVDAEGSALAVTDADEGSQ